MRSIVLIVCIAISFGSIGQSQLDKYLKLAAEQNPGLQAKYKVYEAALQKVKGTGVLPDPTFSYGYFISPVETRVGPQRMKFSLTQMFPWFGTLKAQRDVAALDAEARFELFIDARNKLYKQVKSAYFPLIEINELIKLEQENIRILESYKTIATRQFGSGNSSMVDVLRVDIRLGESKTKLKILEQQIKSLQADFNALLNRALEEEIEISDSPTLDTSAHEDELDSAIVDNPVIKSLELKRQAQIKRYDLATKQSLPNIGFGLDYTIVGERTDVAVPDNGKDIVMPMVSVSIPIHRKKYNAAKEQASLMEESYMLLKTDYSNQLMSNFENTLFKIESQEQLIALYNKQIDEAQQALNLLVTAYGSSGKEFEEVLSMQQQVLGFQKMKVSAMTNYNIAQAEMDYILSNNY